ncbi:MFS transporter [Phreatobacter sp. AB_2022a]|uniref:MFS transporter n=1 Tax=Phreatobacter sp. AB_2022a TaxID=3003134 RepID=UPI002286E5FE|nr:MFS transporter [Phreatobacter sp. AB_2022a]MCZ0733399.1 MFS transporter [Phreatobacter sp. AB_2022a]
MTSTSPTAPADPRQFILSITAAIACIVAVGIGLSLSIPLISFALDAKGASRTVIGLNSAMGGVATLVCAPFISGWARRFGVRPVLLWAVALGIVSFLGFLVIEPLWAWFPLRFVFGVALTVLFVLSEYWINAVAPEERRGLVLSIYVTALSLGFAAGPQILTMVGTSGPAPYLVGSALFALSMLPVLIARGIAPSIEEEPSRGFAAFLWAAPAATLAALVFGAAETGAFALLPLYGIATGLDAVAATTLVSFVSLGNLVFQVPLGLVADRIDRRVVLLFCAAVGAIGMATMAFVPMSRTALVVLLFVWGGIVAGLYTVGLAHLGGRFRGADLAQANAAFVVMYSAGLIVGPPLAGFGMDLWPPTGLPATLGALFAAYVGVIVIRLRGSRGGA